MNNTRNTSPFLKIFLTVVSLLALCSLCFNVNVPFEFTGLLACIFILWLVTEAAGWKSDEA